MNFLYREGTAAAEKQLRDLALVSYGQYKGMLTEENWNKLKTHLKADNLFSGLLETSHCVVCEGNGEIIGMAFLVPKGHPTEIFQTDWSYIRMVGVHPNFAGHGIGKKLTQWCIDFAKRTNENVVALHTAEFMDAARHIYESLGFKQTTELDLRYGKKYWLYKLEL